MLFTSGLRISLTLLMIPILVIKTSGVNWTTFNLTNTYVSIELGGLFENLYRGCYSLKIFSETENVQGQNGHNREPKLILKSYCVKLVDLACNNG